LDRKQGGPQNRFRQDEKEKESLAPAGGRPALLSVTVLIEISRLLMEDEMYVKQILMY
jgi:hypothetical protein